MVVVKLLACTLSAPWSTQLGCSASHGWRWMHASSVPKPAAVQPTASDRSSLGLLASPYATLVKLLDGEVNRANLAAKLHALPLVLRNETEKKAGSMKQQGRGGTEVEQTISDTNYLFYGERGEGPQR
ncbi:hypothetical protein H105_00135 [Trichophyton soudanense CBS 452.61]|uniref:Uncharacterized protein n=1 Tax=Trichophyton soudanense CBS 452.61 TaxID=1215331 RepID=A0A022Y8B0_TRISD|nr:hypothetical protein H105_00135 [Trichophyton soudanense CBS 452.61]KMQ44311.1 hypothetical protein HL42_4981 [Trichophyton rubrum]